MKPHAETFQPPEQQPSPNAKQAFSFLAGILMIAVYTLGVFWAMLVKKPGTVGTRAYSFDLLCGITLLTALSQNSWYPDKYLFVGSLILLPVMYIRHIGATLKQPDHVHTKCIGGSRFGNSDKAKALEFFFGIGAGLIVAATGCMPFGLFIMASSTANMVRQAMLDERDRQRSVQMADAMAEQKYMMEHFEKYQRERNKKCN